MPLRARAPPEFFKSQTYRCRSGVIGMLPRIWTTRPAWFLTRIPTRAGSDVQSVIATPDDAASTVRFEMPGADVSARWRRYGDVAIRRKARSDTPDVSTLQLPRSVQTTALIRGYRYSRDFHIPP